MSKHLSIKTDDIEIEKVDDVARVYIKDFGFYEQVGKVVNFTHSDSDMDSDIAYAISKIVEVL